MVDQIFSYTQNPGDFIILRINGSPVLRIGEVKTDQTIKVEDSGVFSKLKNDDYVIDGELTYNYQ
jgi:hypothetical protein